MNKYDFEFDELYSDKIEIAESASKYYKEMAYQRKYEEEIQEEYEMNLPNYNESYK